MKTKIILIAASLFLLSCNDSFLERYPLDEISSEAFWNSEAELKLYSNSIYTKSADNSEICINIGHGASAWHGNDISIWYLDAWSDNLVASPMKPRMNTYNEIRSGTHRVQEIPRYFGYQEFGLLREINFGLQNYYKSGLPLSTVNKYTAEARFFRAWFYADKIQKFGKMKWINKPLNIDSPELFEPRDSRDLVMDSVLADINFAIEYLPESWPNEEPGRFNKYHALVLKSRICLFEGTFRKYHAGSDPEYFGNLDSNKWLLEAANAAKMVIESGKYRIYNTGNPENDYNSWQRIIDLRGNTEVIQWMEYKNDKMRNNIIQRYFFDNCGTATKSLVDDYLCIDGRPIVMKEGINPLYKGDNKIEDVFINRDPRLRQSVLHPADQAKYDLYTEANITFPRLPGMIGGIQSTTGYHFIKNFNRKQRDEGFYISVFPAIMMRYAEVLLNYVEAKAELGEITQEVLDQTINQLRDRVNMPHLLLNAIPDDPRYEDISPLLTEIRRERRIELVGEGFRYFDLLRWKQGKLLATPSYGIRWDEAAKQRYSDAIVKSSVIKDPITGEMVEYIDPFKGTSFEKCVFDENKHYLWPLPLNILSKNENLKQNPGW